MIVFFLEIKFEYFDFDLVFCINQQVKVKEGVIGFYSDKVVVLEQQIVVMCFELIFKQQQLMNKISQMEFKFNFSQADYVEVVVQDLIVWCQYVWFQELFDKGIDFCIKLEDKQLKVQ